MTKTINITGNDASVSPSGFEFVRKDGQKNLDKNLENIRIDKFGYICEQEDGKIALVGFDLYINPHNKELEKDLTWEDVWIAARDYIENKRKIQSSDSLGGEKTPEYQSGFRFGMAMGVLLSSLINIAIQAAHYLAHI